MGSFKNVKQEGAIYYGTIYYSIVSMVLSIVFRISEGFTVGGVKFIGANGHCNNLGRYCRLESFFDRFSKAVIYLWRIRKLFIRPLPSY